MLSKVKNNGQKVLDRILGSGKRQKRGGKRIKHHLMFSVPQPLTRLLVILVQQIDHPSPSKT
jgi:hypothetical protein